MIANFVAALLAMTDGSLIAMLRAGGVLCRLVNKMVNK